MTTPWRVTVICWCPSVSNLVYELSLGVVREERKSLLEQLQGYQSPIYQTTWNYFRLILGQTSYGRHYRQIDMELQPKNRRV